MGGWECEELGGANPPAAKCAKDGEDCSKNTNCCRSDFVCYVKHDTWSNCNAKCTTEKGKNNYDTKDAWSCEIHGLTYGDNTTLPVNANATVQLAACMNKTGCVE